MINNLINIPNFIHLDSYQHIPIHPHHHHQHHLHIIIHLHQWGDSLLILGIDPAPLADQRLNHCCRLVLGSLMIITIVIVIIIINIGSVIINISKKLTRKKCLNIFVSKKLIQTNVQMNI